MTIAEKATALQSYLTALRRDFHAHPEISLNEFRTADRIEEELDKLNIVHKRCGNTGVYAVLHGAKPGTGVIALRADTDALAITETHKTAYQSQSSGVMHACGHDAHTACLLGAAKLLSEERTFWGGEIRFFFQPAEEVGAGTKEFIDAGCLHGVQRIFGLHTASDLPVGTIAVKAGPNNAAVDYFKITVQGCASHVSTPHQGVDALYIASQIVVMAQALTTRLHTPTEPMVIGVGTLHAGTAYNILAGQAVLEGTTRTLTAETRATVKQQMNTLVQQTAQLFGGVASIEWTDITPPLINPQMIVSEVQQQASFLPGIQVLTHRALSLGGDNFAEYQQLVPGVYTYLGTQNPANPNTALPHHNDGFDIDEHALVHGAALYAQYAFWWLTQGNTADQ